MKKELGKIKDVYFGRGGYQDMQFGLFLTFSVGNTSEVGSGILGGWCMAMIPDENTKWTEESRTLSFGEMAKKIDLLLAQAKVNEINKLINTPVELTFDGMMLKDWRILTEVL